MAAKKDTARSRIESIKTDLRSISTCTATVAPDLQHLLAEQYEEPIQKENLRVKSSQVLSARSTTRGKAAKTPITAAVDAAKQTSDSLAPREKYILATEVVNIALKSLADALKAQPSPQILGKRSKSKAPASDDTRTPAKPHTTHPRALQERSISQIINSPQKPSLLRRSTSYSSFLTTGPDPGLLATAECARIAFSYLRTPEAVKTAGKDSPELQLENGILAFIGKLVAHNLDSLAIKELRVLKRRLDHHLGNSSDDGNREARRANGKVEPRKVPVPMEKETLASMLDFGDVDRKSAALPLITSYQIYALRILARISRPRIIEAAWEALQISNQSSPINLIWHTAKTPNFQVKATRQLESLAQIILSLCPSVSSADDAIPGEEQLQPSPDIVFRLQHLAFQIRKKWWSLAEHQGNEEKELSEPFSKCVIAFARRSKTSTVKKYKTAEALYTDLCGSVDNPLSSTKRSVSVEQAAKTLSSLAQAAGLAEEALRWLGTSASPDKSKASVAKTAARIVRILTLSLDAATKDASRPDLEDNIANTIDALSGSLGGSASELDSLFLEINTLRRMASRILSSTAAVISTKSESKTIQTQMTRIIAACVHFSVRYLGTKPPVDADTKALTQYNDRAFKTAKFTKNIIDSVITCCKQPIDSDTSWNELSTVMQDCVRILQHFGEDLSEDLQGSFVKISNAYWAISLRVRNASGSPEFILMAMERSIDLLRARTQQERQSGLLAMKLEKLGEALDYLDRNDRSRDAFFQCAENLLSNGALEELIEAAATQPIQGVFQKVSETGTLGRVLKSYHRSFIKDGTKDSVNLAFYDNCDLPNAARGALLEWQLALYIKSLSRNRPWNFVLTSSIQQISKRVLQIYSPSEFPIRRQRAHLLLLQLSQENPDILPSETLQLNLGIDPDAAQSSSQDLKLARYRSHFETFLKFKTSMQELSPPMSTVQECLSTWQTLVASTSSWKDLNEQVDDPESWIQELQALADYLAAKGEEYVCLPALHLLVTVLEFEKSSDPSRLVTARCTFGHQLLQLGYTGKAGLSFAKAEHLLKNEATSTEAKLRWHISYAEYLLRIGHITKCESVLSAAEILAKADADFMSLAKSSATSLGRVRFNRILADACFVSSVLAISNGNHKDAARHAKQCVVLNRRVWSALEAKNNARKTSQPSVEAGGMEFANSTFDPLSSMRNDKGVPLVMSTTHDALDGAEFWPIVPALYRGLMQQSTVYAHEGLLHEAMFFAEQAEKIALATRSRSLVLDNASRRAEFWTHSGRPDKAKPLLDAIDLSEPYQHLAVVGYYSSLARMHHLMQDVDNELAAYEIMEGLLNGLTMPSYIRGIDTLAPSVDALAEQMSAISLISSEPADKKPTRNTRGRRPATKTASKPVPKLAPKSAAKVASTAAPKAARKVAQAVAPKTPSILEECSSLCNLQADVNRRKALANLLQDNVSEALILLDRAQDLEKGLDQNVLHLWTVFKITLSQSMKELAKNFTFNSLPESTIAFPAISQKDGALLEGSLGKRSGVGIPATVRGSKTKKPMNEAFIETLREARERLVEAHALCSTTGSSHSFQQASYALSHVTVLLSAVSSGEMRGSLHPLYAAYMSEIPKSNTLRFLQESVEAEHESMSREDLLKWPEQVSSQGSNLACASEFQTQYIDIIPEKWTAVSLALNEEHDELYITRYECGQTPFVLRLPMARHTNRDADEEEFTFDDGKRDFDEIIELSDFSTRSAKDMITQKLRLQWWEERDALDNRLRELLINMENIWLGGFKGIFSQHIRQPTLLARFRKSFENILDRHLPSRQAKKQPKKTILDTRVLELFIGLGDATNEELDLDEALMDLIYFVVDILQFNGERNAYDEIDFDAIVIETLDALRAYQDATQNNSTRTTHTILILDKNLHNIPWESLPCLQSLSISRLPSLAALRERILAAKASKDPGAQPGHYISVEAGGTSILNPSGDLTHTVKTLKPHLNEMQGSWTHIQSRAPTESEFESSLATQELVLYFGHGSGAQFVRSRSVRKLYPGEADREKRPGCATTFLFGCSSVHLSDNGIYEPSGMLASYLTAGAPAVVGMLWDVTDKDCDRFAVRAGELWGLWPESSETEVVPKTPGKGKKGKGKVSQLVEQVEGARGAGTAKKGGKRGGGGMLGEDVEMGEAKGMMRRIGLDEAVGQARDACVLRYLNGAAAVVYGIPVYLE